MSGVALIPLIVTLACGHRRTVDYVVVSALCRECGRFYAVTHIEREGHRSQS